MQGLKHLRRLTLALRQIPGGVLAGDVIRKSFGGRDRLVEVRDFDGDLRLELNLGEHMQGQIFWHGSYSRNIIFLLKEVLKPGFVVIDGGANIGEISLIAAKRVGPDGRVFAFEPIDRLANQLESHIAANRLTNVRLSREALSDELGKANIFMAHERFRDGTSHDGLGTLFQTDIRSSVEASVTLTTLDCFVAENGIARVDLIKLDVEGSELKALKGAASVLREHKPALIVEVAEMTCRAAGYEMEDIVSFVRELGYSIFVIGRRGGLVPLERTGLRKFQNLFCVQ